ncbi:hypothetical protein V5799_034251 [Amblyomma americanum]|uniref:BEN domain-containing protein n=2 Tax=Amblyomma americanum TaxID=6943 RepID=A0AAQ4DL01_AMBAM
MENTDKVQVLPGLIITEAKWNFLLQNRSDAKFTLEMARVVWSREEAAARSLTGEACRSMAGSLRKMPATPEKVEAVANCLQKYVELHPAAEPPVHSRVGAARKYLRSFFTEAGRQGKRGKAVKTKSAAEVLENA